MSCQYFYRKTQVNFVKPLLLVHFTSQQKNYYYLC